MQIIQEVSDRLLYLPDDDVNDFVHYLSLLFDAYCIDCEEVNGVRVIKNNRYENKARNPKKYRRLLDINGG